MGNAFSWEAQYRVATVWARRPSSWVTPEASNCLHAPESSGHYCVHCGHLICSKHSHVAQATPPVVVQWRVLPVPRKAGSGREWQGQDRQAVWGRMVGVRNLPPYCRAWEPTAVSPHQPPLLQPTRPHLAPCLYPGVTAHPPASPQAPVALAPRCPPQRAQEPLLSFLHDHFSPSPNPFPSQSSLSTFPSLRSLSLGYCFLFPCASLRVHFAAERWLIWMGSK